MLPVFPEIGCAKWASWRPVVDENANEKRPRAMPGLEWLEIGA
jgi:hypothetical protein